MKKSIIAKFLISLGLSLMLSCAGAEKRESKMAETKEEQSVKAEAPVENTKEFAKEETQAKKDEAKQSDEAEAKAKAPKEEESIKGVTNANLENQKNRKFLRQAETKMQVKNVQNTTRKIEDLMVKYKGFITSANMKAQVMRIENNPLSIDSLIELKFYEVNNELILRVPNEKMDSLMRNIQDLGHFIEYVTATADDMSFEILGHQLAGKRYDKSNNRVENAINNKGKELYSVENAENNLLERQLQSDNNKIAQMQLEDKINYSRIKVYLYQRETIKRENIVNPQKLIFQPTFLQRMSNAFYFGWVLVQEFIILLTNLWLFWLILIGGVVVFRKWKARKS